MRYSYYKRTMLNGFSRNKLVLNWCKAGIIIAIYIGGHHSRHELRCRIKTIQPTVTQNKTWHWKTRSASSSNLPNLSVFILFICRSDLETPCPREDAQSLQAEKRKALQWQSRENAAIFKSEYVRGCKMHVVSNPLLLFFRILFFNDCYSAKF